MNKNNFYVHIDINKAIVAKWKRIKSILNSQRKDYIILLIPNIIQLRDLGLIYIKIDKTVQQLTLIEIEMERHCGF